MLSSPSEKPIMARTQISPAPKFLWSGRENNIEKNAGSSPEKAAGSCRFPETKDVRNIAAFNARVKPTGMHLVRRSQTDRTRRPAVRIICCKIMKPPLREKQFYTIRTTPLTSACLQSISAFAAGPPASHFRNRDFSDRSLNRRAICSGVISFAILRNVKFSVCLFFAADFTRIIFVP